MNKRQLATKIWDAANKMRSKIEANEYKDYILGFIFYKYLSDREERYLDAEGYPKDEWQDLVTEEDKATVDDLTNALGYFIPYSYLFSSWINSGNDFEVGQVRDALSSFTRHIKPTHKGVFEGIFDTLQTGLSKLGDSAPSQTKAISKLIHLIEEIPMDGKQDYDVLGFIYEYLISQFAANAGKKAGEFYTPHEVSLLMSELVAHHLQQRDAISIYDPTSGSGSLLINIGHSMSKYIAPGKISYHAQELKANTYNLTRMNLVMRGISPDNISTRNADTLEEDWPLESDGGFNPLWVDSVVSNPPYSQNWDPTNKEIDPRYAEFGLAPKSKADYAFLLHDLYHLKNDGIMCIVLPHGVLFRGGEEGEIRKKLLEKNHIHAIIGLPANIFFGTGIPTIVMVLRRQRAERDVLIVDASRGFTKVGKNNKLRACDIRKITDAVNGRSNIDKFSRCVSMEEIRNNDYNLNIPRYVDSSEPAETWDIYASMFGGVPAAELDALHAYWDALPGLKESLFLRNENGYYTPATENFRHTIAEHSSVIAFKQQFTDAFASLPDTLRALLINNIQTVEPALQEATLSSDIITRADKLPLVDRYTAYQLFQDNWGTIASDLEIIQSEGLGTAARQVDPKMVTKKKDGKDVEVQEGWMGHIIPFEIVQNQLLSVELSQLEQKQSDLASVESELTSIIEELDSEEQEKLLNDNNDAFVPAKLKEAVKQLYDEVTSPVIEVLSHYLSLPNNRKNIYVLEHQEVSWHQMSVGRGGVYGKKVVEQFIKQIKTEILESVDAPSNLAKAATLIEKQKDLKKELKESESLLHEQTKRLIETLADEQIPALLEKKWISPLSDALSVIPNAIVTSLADKVQALALKYATTLSALEADIDTTEHELAALLEQLTGSPDDLAGIHEFQRILSHL